MTDSLETFIGSLCVRNANVRFFTNTSQVCHRGDVHVPGGQVLGRGAGQAEHAAGVVGADLAVASRK